VRAVVAVVAVAAALWFFVLPDFFSARREQGRLERDVVLALRHGSIPPEIRERKNPLPATKENVAAGREHFADHCAICHGNDGSGRNPMNAIFDPPVPDMREQPTQSISDGELFYVIRNGVRFSGMPAWGSGRPEEDDGNWQLVHFIRHLPSITEGEIAAMEKLNPRSPADTAEEDEATRFLEGKDDAAHHH